jgi:hypothetical protein
VFAAQEHVARRAEHKLPKARRHANIVRLGRPFSGSHRLASGSGVRSAIALNAPFKLMSLPQQHPSTDAQSIRRRCLDRCSIRTYQLRDSIRLVQRESTCASACTHMYARCIREASLTHQSLHAGGWTSMPRARPGVLSSRLCRISVESECHTTAPTMDAAQHPTLPPPPSQWPGKPGAAAAGCSSGTACTCRTVSVCEAPCLSRNQLAAFSHQPGSRPAPSIGRHLFRNCMQAPPMHLHRCQPQVHQHRQVPVS